MSIKRLLGFKFSRATSRFLILAIAGLSSLTHAGGTIDFSLSDDSARLAIDAAKLGSGLHLAVGLQHDQDKGDIASLAAHVVDVRDHNRQLYLGVGGNLYAIKADNDEEGATIGVGGFFRYAFDSVKDLSLAGYGYYAPPVVSFGDVRNLYDVDFRVQYHLIPTARIFVGYRDTAIAFEDISDRTNLGSGYHFGIKLDF